VSTLGSTRCGFGPASDIFCSKVRSHETVCANKMFLNRVLASSIRSAWLIAAFPAIADSSPRSVTFARFFLARIQGGWPTSPTGKYNAVSSTVGGEITGGAPLLALVEKWLPPRLPGWVLSSPKNGVCRHSDEDPNSGVGRIPLVSAVGWATSRKAREVAHPLLFLCQQLTIPRCTFPRRCGPPARSARFQQSTAITLCVLIEVGSGRKFEKYNWDHH